jgi:hypothetical protein
MTLDPFPEVPERLKRAGLRASILAKYRLVPYAVCTCGAVSYRLHRAGSAGLPRQA